MLAVGLAAAGANVASSFNPRVSRKADSTANRANRANRADRVDSKAVAVANVTSRFNPRLRRKVGNMANRADSKAVARVRVKERKAKLPQLHLRGN